jgi:beta-lactamase superfamily II metal-dependent hydrolase
MYSAANAKRQTTWRGREGVPEAGTEEAMAKEESGRALERPVVTGRLRKSNMFSARGRLACRENLGVLGLATLAAAVWLAGSAFSAGGPAGRRAALPGGLLAVQMLDVEQGDGILVQTPDLVRALIDAGPAPVEGGSPFSAGRDKIAPFLREAGIDRVDAFVISHAHADHIGGLPYLLQSVPIGRVYDPGFAFTSDLYVEALERIEQSEGAIDYGIVRQGDSIQLGKDVLCQVLAPPQPYISGTRSDCNSNSIVVRLVYRNVSFLFMGDAEEETEKALAEYGNGLRSTFLKVAHHGSRYSSSKHFLDLVRPRYALISCGRNNAFGHPHEEALERLHEAGADILRTDLHGDVLVLTDGESYKIVTGREP